MAHWHYHSRTGSGSATPSLGAVSPACRHASHVSVYVSTEQRRLGDFASYASDIDHDRWHAMAAGAESSMLVQVAKHSSKLGPAAARARAQLAVASCSCSAGE